MRLKRSLQALTLFEVLLALTLLTLLFTLWLQEVTQVTTYVASREKVWQGKIETLSALELVLASPSIESPQDIAELSLSQVELSRESQVILNFPVEQLSFKTKDEGLSVETKALRPLVGF